MHSRSLSVIQIGDIHLPDFRDARIVDDKDKGFPRALLERIAPSRLTLVTKSLLQLIESKDENKPSALLISGDLTSRGDLAAYRECIQYLCDTLQLTNGKYWLEDHIHVVPGNHDINRAIIDPNADLYAKFLPLEQQWKLKGLPIFTNSEERHTRVEKSQMRMDLFSINSCLGCGAKDYLPEKIRDQLADLLKATSFELQAVQLDTPAFDHNTLTSLNEKITSLTATTMPIVLSHHNILPQAEPRIELYTEAVNGGLVRAMLSQLKRPVLYCHGHLHKDPIEIVSSPRAGKGRLVSISAPLLSDGFNRIDIHFSRSGIPIGCVVTPYRLGTDAIVHKEECIRIPLGGQRDTTRITTDNLCSSVLDATRTQARRFPDLFKSVKSEDGIQPSESDFLDSLLELEWSGMVQITDREDNHTYWQIYRTEP